MRRPLGAQATVSSGAPSAGAETEETEAGVLLADVWAAAKIDPLPAAAVKTAAAEGEDELEIVPIVASALPGDAWFEYCALAEGETLPAPGGLLSLRLTLIRSFSLSLSLSLSLSVSEAHTHMSSYKALRSRCVQGSGRQSSSTSDSVEDTLLKRRLNTYKTPHVGAYTLKYVCGTRRRGGGGGGG